MSGGKGKALLILGLMMIQIQLPSCRSAEPPTLDPANLALLRLEYLERASLLPALNIESIKLPSDHRLGRFSPVVWRVRSDQAPGREFYRPLPVEDVDLLLYSVLTRTMEDFGFNMRGWSGGPDLRMRVEVERLVLSSAEGAEDTRACELALLFHVDEYPSGLEVESFHGRAQLQRPGSWTTLQGEEAIWTPRGNDEDPILLATAAAVQHFLNESLAFWKVPSNWEDGSVNLSNAKHP